METFVYEEYKKMYSKSTNPSELECRYEDGLLKISPDFENWSSYTFKGWDEQQAREFTAWHIDADHFYYNKYVSAEDKDNLWNKRKNDYESKWGESIFKQSLIEKLRDEMFEKYE